VKVADILDSKGHGVKCVRKDDTIGTLAQRLQQERVGAMIVSDDAQTLEGIISERDIAYGLAARRGDFHLVKVSVLMTKSVLTCRQETTIPEAMAMMAARHIRHLPVVEDGKLVGIISMRDLIEHRVVELERRTRLMEKVVSTIA